MPDTIKMGLGFNVDMIPDLFSGLPDRAKSKCPGYIDQNINFSEIIYCLLDKLASNLIV